MTSRELIAARLRKIRAERFKDNATEAARALGVPPPTYLAHENASRGIPRDVALRYARFFGVSIEWLLTGKGEPRGRKQVPVVSYVGAGAELFPVDDHPKGQGLELVDAPAREPDCVGAKIKGDSMQPLRDGWLVFWRKDQEGVPEDAIGKLCVVKLVDGRMFLKSLHRGSTKHHFTLISWNAAPMLDQVVEWAARVIEIRPD